MEEDPESACASQSVRECQPPGHAEAARTLTEHGRNHQEYQSATSQVRNHDINIP